jgi:predicted RNA-binding Zn-ribbon protein involved in translation (DUF1610 family)
MAEIAFSCPSCRRGYQVDAGLAGKKFRCKGCNEIARIPASARPSLPPPDETELRFPCPRCGYGFNLSARLAGKRARCKQCGDVFRVPEQPSHKPAQFALDPQMADHGSEEYSLVETEPPQGSTVASPRNAGKVIGDDASQERNPGAAVAKSPGPGTGREGLASALKSWLGYRLRILGLAAGLSLLLWAFSSLFPRAWHAGQVLFGGATESPNDPMVTGAGDPELDLADIAPERLGVLRQHEQVLQEIAQAFLEMAQGFATMRNHAQFAAGREDVTRAAEKLDQAGQRWLSLPRLERAEKAALANMTNFGLKRNAAGAGQGLAGLMRTPGVKGDFGKVLDAIGKAQKQFDQEFPGDAPRPAVQLIMRRIDDPTQQKIIVEKAGALVGRPALSAIGWGTERETSRLKLATVYSAADFANRVTFGKVRRVQGRRIELDVEPPTAEEIRQFQDKAKGK